MEHKKKILIISTSYAEISSGREAAGSFVNAFVNDLNRLDGVDVKVIYPSISEKNRNAIEKPFKVDFLPLSLLKIKKLSHWITIYKTLKNGKKAVIEETTKFQPDHIFALWALPSGFWAKKAAKSLNIDYSIWCLGSDIWSLSKIPIVKSILKNILLKSKINFADGYQLCSDVEKISAQKCLFLPSSRNLDHTLTKPIESKNTYNLCFIGRWHENKGIDILLESLSNLKENDLNKINKITIAGGGLLESLVKKKVKTLVDKGLPVKLKGFVNKNEATKLIIESDFMLIPSRIESIPVIFSDSIQLLRPVIAMPVGDLPFLLKKYKCGILSNSIDPVAYALSISKALNENIQTLSENLEFTYKDFYLNQKNHIKFMQKLDNHVTNI